MNKSSEIIPTSKENTIHYEPVTRTVNFSHVYTQAGICFIVLDSENNILEFNSAAESVFDIDKDEIIGKKFLSLAFPETEEQLDTMLQKCTRRGFVKDFDICLRSGLNKKCWVKINGKTESTDEHEDAAIQLFIQDVSDVQIKNLQNDLLMYIFNLDDEEKKQPETIHYILQQLHNIAGCDLVGLSTPDICYDTSNNTDDDEDQLQSRKNPDEWEKLTDFCVQENFCSCDDKGGYLIKTIPSETQLSDHEIDHALTFDLAGYQSVYVLKIDSTYEQCLYFLSKHTILYTDEQKQFFAAAASVFKKSTQQNSPPEIIYSSHDDDNASNSGNNPISGVITVKKGLITDVNEWMERFTGYDREALIGKPYCDLIPQEYQRTIKDLQDKANDNEQYEGSIEIAVFDKDANLRKIECAFRHIPLNGNSLDIWYWINNEEKNWLQRQLYQARKMESLGMLSGGIVHDFNNLMASILGYSSLLSEDLSPSDPRYDDIRQIHLTSEKATELTSRLMAYAHGSEYIVNDLDVNQLVTEVAGILSRTLEKNIMIRAELSPELKTITADASQIQQVILQVALNARDAMPSGGKIIFHSKNIKVDETSAWIKQGALPGDYIQLAISDTGKGMSLDVKEQIFRPHFTTQESESGKGLGLSMVSEIVSNHKGFISVFSELGKGSMFKIHFPANTYEMDENDSSAVNKPSLGKETILLVDDERLSRETARMMLTRYGYKVISAESGRDAALIFKKYSDRVDLIILDLLMPGVNTNKMILHLRQINPEIPIMASSAKGDITKIETMVREKLSGVLTKPFQVRPLLQSIRTVLNA